jgi:hypothetical protein
MQYMQITEDEFVRAYCPICNHLDLNAAFDWGQGFGTMFETFGNELQFVRSQPASCVWTFVSADGYDSITSGYHLVNRVGYFVCSKPVADGLVVEVELDFS